MTFSAGAKLGRYEIISALGAGGMGEVYRARDMQLQRDVAIKVLPQTYSEDRVALKRLEREARTVASISHPNILDIHDFGNHNGTTYVVTELLEGRTLKDMIRKGPLKIQEALKIGISIAEGLHAAHSKGIVHRDLKPDNIFITSDLRVKILDFGLAILKPVLSSDELSDASTASGLSALSSENAVHGTVPYMSPEQVRGRSIDSRSDIFAFGSVLYEMIAGRPPFQRETVADSVAAILREEPRYESELKALPPFVFRLLKACLEKEPDQRMPDAHQLVSILKEALDTASYPIARQMRERSLFSRMSIPAIGVLIILVLLASIFLRRNDFRSSGNISSLVVLPLKNMSGNPQDEYFVDGITEEITARLARFANLRVISRTSAMHYKETNLSLKDIGRELGVDVVLEGSIRRTGGRVRIVTNLIEADSDRNIWSQTYEHDMQDVLELQNQVAYNISKELKTQLTPYERAVLEKRETVLPEAYDSYLRGISHEQKGDYSKDNILKEIAFYRKAILADPNFALPYVALARAHGVMHHFRFDPAINHAAEMKRAIDRAFEIQPDLPEAELALAYYYYWCLEDYHRALRQFESVGKSLPNNTKVLEGIAHIERRYGDCNKALSALRKAIRLSPKELRIVSELANTLTLVRQYSEADRYYERAIALAPDQIYMYQYRIDNFYLWEGRTERAKTTLDQFPDKEDRSNILYWLEYYVYNRQYSSALETIHASEEEVFDRRPFYKPKVQLIADVYRLSKNQKLAVENYEKARLILEQGLEKSPDDPRILTGLGLVYAALGRSEEAVAFGKKGVTLCSLEKDRYDGFFRELDLLKIYSLTGKYNDAFELADRLLSKPCLISIPFMKLDPDFEGLLNQSRFQQLSERYSKL